MIDDFRTSLKAELFSLLHTMENFKSTIRFFQLEISIEVTSYNSLIKGYYS